MNMMNGFGRFGMEGISYSKLSNTLLQLKQVSTDVSGIIPVSLDTELLRDAPARTPVYDLLRKKTPRESTYYPTASEAGSNFGKFDDESLTRSHAAQKATYTGTSAGVACKLMTYEMNIGLIAQKNVSSSGLDLVREEQATGLEAMRKGIERALITGAPAAATDGGVTDAFAFEGLDTLITGTNVVAVDGDISLNAVDEIMQKCTDAGAQESNLLLVSDSATLNKFSSLFYKNFSIQMPNMKAQAGFRVSEYNTASWVTSDFSPTTAGSRKLHCIDRGSTVIPEFWKISQLDLGRTGLSDDSIMFWMGALSVGKEDRNGILTGLS